MILLKGEPRFLYLKVNVFKEIWKNVGHHFLKGISCPSLTLCSFGNSRYIHIRLKLFSCSTFLVFGVHWLFCHFQCTIKPPSEFLHFSYNLHFYNFHLVIFGSFYFFTGIIYLLTHFSSYFPSSFLYIDSLNFFEHFYSIF